MTGDYRHAPDRDEAAAAPEPRIYGPFPAVVKGVDAFGGRFKVQTVLESLSAGYCAVRLDGPPGPGESISVAARINRAVVVLRGTVLDLPSLAAGVRSVAVRITRYRFVPRRAEPARPEQT